MPARQLMGSFVPSNGVGGFTRGALERLASTEHNLIFAPSHQRLRQRSPAAQSRLQPGLCSTVRPRFGDRSEARIFPTNRAHRRLSAQPLDHRDRGPVLGAARLARPAAPGRLVWRDRKGLFGNPFSLLTNLLFIYGILLWIGARIASVPWGLARYSFHPGLLATLGIQAVQTAVRFGCNAHRRSILRLRCASPILMWKLDQFHGALSRCIPIPSRTPSMGQDRERLPLPHPLSPSTSAGSARYSRAPAMHRKTSSTKP
jgi:hypothetical protein